MSFAGNLQALYHHLLRRPRGATHAARLENLYAPQSHAYDQVRERLLHGRQEMYQRLAALTAERAPGKPGEGVWVDLGGGTARCLEFLGPHLASLSRLYIVDVAPSLLKIAELRRRLFGWTNVELVCADAATFHPPEGAADVVTLSYSLSMTQDWTAALENARRMLRPGGRLGIVDFYISETHPAPGRTRHAPLARAFWPLWFACGHVRVSSAYVPWLHANFAPAYFAEHRAPIAWPPVLRVPYFVFVGVKNPRDAGHV